MKMTIGGKGGKISFKFFFFLNDGEGNNDGERGEGRKYTPGEEN